MLLLLAAAAAVLLGGADEAAAAWPGTGPVVVTPSVRPPSAAFAGTRVVEQFRHISRDYDAKFDDARNPAPVPSVWLMAPRDPRTVYAQAPTGAETLATAAAAAGPARPPQGS
jgi:hypothetical protein